MRNRVVSAFLLLGGLGVVGFSVAQDAPQTKNCEDVFKNIQVFKGVPATDLLPMMEFMSASLGMKCSDCHDTKDYSADTRAKGTARRMVEMQRDINKNFFRNRNQVTCMSCHNGSERPRNIPFPEGISLRHERVTNPPKAADLFAKYGAATGKAPTMLVRKGKLTSPGTDPNKPDVEEVEFDQASDGRFKIVTPSATIVSDGTKVMFNTSTLWGEAKETYTRVGKMWLGDDTFADLKGTGVVGS
ncbi:MAG TPA: photosynthetic reaction center cytochrome c subunit family protein, partial [Fimbriimonadaceae bacterium]|nr:photosynthetic reaction center cytochrome c subunit family protein [Fimbriimonadaceae bacterium]